MKKIAIVRGKFLNKYELQFYEPLVSRYDLLGIGSLTCFHDKFKFPVKKLFSPVDLPNFPFKMPFLNRLFIDANYLFGLENLLKGFAIAHSAETYYHFTIQCLNAKRKGLIKRVVVSAFENIPFAGEGIWGRKAFKKRVFKEVDHLIAVSEMSKSTLLIEGCPREKISVINQHIDTSRFKPKVKKNKTKDITVLFVGRLEFYKGVYDFVKAAKFLLSDKSLRKYRLKFVMVGEGSQKHKLLQLEKDLRISRFFLHKVLPYEKMPQVYQRSDIFIVPSRTTKHWQEQFSTVLLEAKASGLPIISTKTGGIPENVGKAGILVEEGDHQEIARQTAVLIKNPNLRIKLGEQARKDALKRFTIEDGAKKLSLIYEKVYNVPGSQGYFRSRNGKRG